MGNFTFRVSRYFSFAKKEINAIFLAALVFGFALSFRDWGVTEFNVQAGLFNFLNSTLIVLLSLIVHESAHKLWALKRGYRTELRNFPLGLLVTTFLVFLTNGLLPLLAYGGVYIHHLKLERLGKFQYYTNLMEHATISAAGPLANLALAFIFKVISPINPTLLEAAVTINLLLCLMNMIPIPPFDGADVFYASRLYYVFIMVFMVMMAAMLHYTPLVWHALWISLVFAVVGWFLFAYKIDKAFD